MTAKVRRRLNRKTIVPPCSPWVLDTALRRVRITCPGDLSRGTINDTGTLVQRWIIPQKSLSLTLSLFPFLFSLSFLSPSYVDWWPSSPDGAEKKVSYTDEPEYSYLKVPWSSTRQVRQKGPRGPEDLTPSLPYKWWQRQGPHKTHTDPPPWLKKGRRKINTRDKINNS